MRKIGLALRIAYFIADNPSIRPTLGDLMACLNLPKGTATGERLREARRKGFDIRHYVLTKDRSRYHCYFMPSNERQRVRETAGYKAWKRQK